MNRSERASTLTLRAIGSACALLAACGGDDATESDAGPTITQVDPSPSSSTTSAPTNTATDSGPPPALDAGSEDSAPPTDPFPIDPTVDYGTGPGMAAPDTAGFHITLDYAYDTQGEFTADRRAALRAAATVWERLIASEFSDVPPGTPLRMRPPEDRAAPGFVFEVDYAIDDLVLFAGFTVIDGVGSNLAGSSHSFTQQVADPTLLADLDTRFHGAVFQPWVASTGFDIAEAWSYDPTPSTDADIPSNSNDFISTALHEIGHVLGIGTADAYFALVQGGAFTGARTMSLYGGPLPLEADTVHIQAQLGGERLLMDPATPVGTRKQPHAIDLAMLSDLGYALTAEAEAIIAAEYP